MGPLTRSVRDAAVALNAIAGFDPRDDTSSREPVTDYLPARGASLEGVRLGVPESFFFDRVDPEVEAAVRAAARAAAELGARVTSVRVPDIAELNVVARVILLAEAAAVMDPHLAQRDNFGSDVLSLLDQGRFIPATDYVNAQRLRRLKQQEFRKVWHAADLLLTPATPITAPRIGQAQVEIDGRAEDVRLATTRLVRAVNLLGVPAVSIPCGFSRAGLPIGAQLIGPPFSEAGLLRAAAGLEASLGVSGREPPGL
jgi:aspartyl-tRNA(Asn)/glutamyl-tRNA(Gln) amidotransferase subunit A